MRRTLNPSMIRDIKHASCKECCGLIFHLMLWKNKFWLLCSKCNRMIDIEELKKEEELEKESNK